MKHYVTIRERGDMVRAYLDGQSLNAIAAETGRDRSVVRAHLLRAGVELRGAGRAHFKPAEIEHIRWLYRHGHTVHKISRATGRSQAGVRGLLKRVGDLKEAA